jgi:predicted CopG family antitoxin
MHIACMATKTISLKLEAYERLRRARRSPQESFSEVVMRAQWPEVGITARELVAVYRVEGAHLSADVLDRIEEADAGDRPPEDKWARR